MRYASDRLRRNGCANARTVRAEAMFILREHVPPASVSVLHVYFPDPWPKARHHKRRLVQLPFMTEAARVLQPNVDGCRSSPITKATSRKTLNQPSAPLTGVARFHHR